MPLEHSESMQMQDMLFSEHKRMFSDILCVLKLKTELEEDMQVVPSIKEVLERRRPALEPWIGTLSRIVSEHRNVPGALRAVPASEPSFQADFYSLGGGSLEESRVVAVG
ncbi:hypothetical protein VDGD_01301 [Verticillium dahliae]|nr:hypothetical protein VDGD_01301 [Verticillium dahliae]